jgi:hypothetical protein
MLESLHESVQTTPRGAAVESLKSVALPLNVDVDVLPMGVMNGETGLLPDELVRLGVAKAGAAATTNVASSARLDMSPLRSMAMTPL